MYSIKTMLSTIKLEDIIQEKVGPGEENSEGKLLNDGCVQGLKYNPFNRSQTIGVLQTVVHVQGEKMG